jgi:hypothetical protein
MSLLEKVIRFTNDIVSSEYGHEIFAWTWKVHPDCILNF